MTSIDMHTHAFPDALAPRAIAALEAGCDWQAVAGGTVTELIESMDQARIDISVVCAIATKPGQAAGILEWCRQIRSDRIVPLPSVHPQAPEAVRWLGKFAEAGFAGIKLHPMYQNFAADDPAMDAIYASAAECGLFIEIHSGRDIAFGQDDRATPARLAKILDRHPNLRLVCTHLGGWRMWDEVERELLGRDVYLETSFSLALVGPERAARIIRSHGAGRVMFGTDWPWASQTEQMQLVEQMGLTEAESKALLWDNAAAMLGIDSPQ